MANPIQRRLLLAALAVVTASVVGAAQPVQSKFDGSWSVLIITDAGTCDRAYRYPVRIAGGQVLYSGDSSAIISGRVNPRGQISVSVRHGDQQASGTGRLSGNVGLGRWQGSSPTQRCAGHWEAERRG